MLYCVMCGALYFVILLVCSPMYQCCVHSLKLYSFTNILYFDIQTYEHILQLQQILQVIAGALDGADIECCWTFMMDTKVKREECKKEERRRRGAEEETEGC